MVSINIRELSAGERVRVRFHGSSVLGNEPWEDDCVFLGVALDGDGEQVAVFDWGEAYRTDGRGRWRYGSSSEVLTVLERV